MASPTRITPVSTTAATDPDVTPDNTTHSPGGMTEEQRRAALAALGRRKNDPEYLRIWEEGIAEYRRMIQEEAERALAEQGK